MSIIKLFFNQLICVSKIIAKLFTNPINQCFVFFQLFSPYSKAFTFNVAIFGFALSRQLEKLSDLFEKLRVSEIFSDKTIRLRKYLSRFCKHFFFFFAFVLLQKVEGRVASDQELKLTELLRYYMRDIQAAKVRHGNPVSFCMVPTQATTGSSWPPSQLGVKARSGRAGTR